MRQGFFAAIARRFCSDWRRELAVAAQSASSRSDVAVCAVRCAVRCPLRAAEMKVATHSSAADGFSGARNPDD